MNEKKRNIETLLNVYNFKITIRLGEKSQGNNLQLQIKKVD